ncbi:MAG: hypothetical protein KDD55_04565 [Bdellovibrionales bacterium]|nr:hypothetical protein [Bdellovibrionales bacterium]
MHSSHHDHQQHHLPIGPIHPLVPDCTRVLAHETRQLEEMVERRELAPCPTPVCGVELEGWLAHQDTLAPALNSLDVLRTQSGNDWGKELGRWNVECNFPPLLLQGDALSQSERWFRATLARLEESAQAQGSTFVLGPTLLTLEEEHLVSANLTPKDPLFNPGDRYHSLDALQQARKGSPFETTFADGSSRLSSSSIILAATTAGLQPHLMCEPEKFVAVYNAAQALAPLFLALAASSPVLAGRKTGFESSRIRVLHDMHSGLREQGSNASRYFFGEQWLESPTDTFHENVLFDPLFEEPLASSTDRELPNIRAHNGTVWRFNRPVYDFQDGAPHIRLESRVMDTALSIVDNVANLAFFHGAILGLVEEHGDVASKLSFQDVHDAFYRAAAEGLDATMNWIDGHPIRLQELALTLLETAERGLSDIDKGDSEKYLSVIRQRVISGLTGSQWIQRGMNALALQGLSDKEQRELLTAYCREMQARDTPVHEWSVPELIRGEK